jgi:hypothetical protein
MKASLLYRVASVLILLYAAGHTFGFRQINPAWGIDDLIRSMRTTHFDAQGFQRTYWDFYVGFGLFVTAFLLLAAVLSWQLGSLPASAWPAMRLTSWVLTFCFGVALLLSWRYFFWIPVVFSAVILLCLLAANLQSSRT